MVKAERKTAPERRERRRGHVDQEAQEDQPGGAAAQLHGLEGQAAGGGGIVGHAGHQDDAAQEVHQDVAEAGLVGAFGVGRPEHQGRAQGHDLPEDEDRDQVAGEGDADGGAGIGEGGGELQDARLAQGEERAGEGHDGEDGAEETAEGVAFQRLQSVV